MFLHFLAMVMVPNTSLIYSGCLQPRGVTIGTARPLGTVPVPVSSHICVFL